MKLEYSILGLLSKISFVEIKIRFYSFDTNFLDISTVSINMEFSMT